MIALRTVEGPFARRPDAIRVAEVIQATARIWDVTPEQVLSDGIIRPFAHPRLATYWIAHRVLDRTSTQIGTILGRDHTSVLSGVRQADALCARDHGFRALLIQALKALDLPANQVPNLKGVN